jgi:hypothetical protein
VPSRTAFVRWSASRRCGRWTPHPGDEPAPNRHRIGRGARRRPAKSSELRERVTGVEPATLCLASTFLAATSPSEPIGFVKSHVFPSLRDAAGWSPLGLEWSHHWSHHGVVAGRQGRRQSGAEVSRTLDLLNAMRSRGERTVLDRAQAFRNSRAPLLPRRQSRTVAHRLTAPEPPQCHGPGVSLNLVLMLPTPARRRRHGPARGCP